MAQQIINTGTVANDGTGDYVRTAWTKANANFTELYASVASQGVEIDVLQAVFVGTNRTYYVSTSGSDAFDGLTIGTPLRTVQAAVNKVKGIITAPSVATTIQLADGTYAESVLVSGPFIGSASVTIQGNAANPPATVISGSSWGVQAANQGVINLQSLRLAASGGPCAFSNASYVLATNVDFVAGASCVRAQNGGSVRIQTTGTFSGGGSAALYAVNGGVIDMSSCAVTVRNAPTYSTGFAYAEAGVVAASGCTFSGSSTGTRYSSILNGVINTGGGGANFFPGTFGGSTATGGQYA
jgi:hypothetical protein